MSTISIPLSALFTFGHSVVAFPFLGPLLQWVLVNYTVFGKSVDYLSQSALEIVRARKKGSNEAVVSSRFNNYDCYTRQHIIKYNNTTYCILYCSFQCMHRYVNKTAMSHMAVCLHTVNPAGLAHSCRFPWLPM